MCENVCVYVCDVDVVYLATLELIGATVTHARAHPIYRYAVEPYFKMFNILVLSSSSG